MNYRQPGPIRWTAVGRLADMAHVAAMPGSPVQSACSGSTDEAEGS